MARPRISAARQSATASSISRKVRRLRPKYLRCGGRSVSNRSWNLGRGAVGSNRIALLSFEAFAGVKSDNFETSPRFALGGGPSHSGTWCSIDDVLGD
jgi:hypothetical protein